MDYEYAPFVMNGALNGMETAIGPSPVVKLRTGARPGISAADSGTVLVPITAPADHMSDASSASKTRKGIWQGVAIANGDAGHFREYMLDGTTVAFEGDVSAEGGSGALGILVNGVPGIAIAIGDIVSIEAFTFNAANAV